MTDNDQRPDPDIAFEFTNDPAAPRGARQALETLFPSTNAFADDVSLVASELVSNVVLHTSEGGHMHAWNDDPLRLEVHDHDPKLPPPVIQHAEPDPTEVGGRGLNIVDEIADEWGAEVDGTGDGKTLWAEFRRPLT